MKLYLSNYKKKLVGTKAGTMSDFVAELNSNASENYTLKFLKKMVQEGCLVFYKSNGIASCFIINEEQIWKILSENEVVALTEKIATMRHITLD